MAPQTTINVKPSTLLSNVGIIVTTLAKELTKKYPHKTRCQLILD